MSVFDDITKKFRKKKITQTFPSSNTVEESQPKITFDFERKTQDDFERDLKEQKVAAKTDEMLDVLDLNTVFWLFVEHQHKDVNEKVQSLDIKSIPMCYVSETNTMKDVVTGKEFALYDVSKGEKLGDARSDGSDMCLFSAYLQGNFSNYRIVGSGAYYNLDKNCAIDSYNAGAPGLLKLFSQSFAEASFANVVDHSQKGETLKTPALVSRKDVITLDGGIKKKYEEQRMEEIKKAEKQLVKTF